MRTVSWIATTAIGLVVAGALVAPQALRWLEASAAAPAEGAVPAPRTVVVTAARPLPDRAVRHLPGTIAARVEADLGFRVGGKVSARRVSVGDTVKAGDVVATLDETDLQLQLEAAEAEQAAARIALEKAEISLGRVATLKAKGWATGQASDLETVAVAEARARLLEAGRTSNSPTTPAPMRRCRRRRRRGDRDPGRGRAGGDLRAAGRPRRPRRRARGGGQRSPRRARRGARSGGERRAVVRPGRAIPAKLRELSPVADATTRTYQARFTLAADGAALELGMTATVSLAGPASGREVVLPPSALVDRGRRARCGWSAPTAGWRAAGDGRRLRAEEVASRRGSPAASGWCGPG